MNCYLDDSSKATYQFQTVKFAPGDKTRLKRMSVEEIDEALGAGGFRPVREPTGFIPYTRWTPEDLSDDCPGDQVSDEL